MRAGFESRRGRFRPLYDAVVAGHRASPYAHRGHGPDHDVTVAMLAVSIAPDPRTADKAFAAALLHSTDRLVDRGNKMAEETHMRVCLGSLMVDLFTMEEANEIVAAVLRHGELNRDDQSVTQQVLMDADRLANMMPAVVMRSGQFRPDIPPFDFEYLAGASDPTSTYHDPKSVLDDLRITLQEYPPQLRVKKAKKLGARYAKQLQAYIDSVEESNREIGLTGFRL